MYIRSVCSRDRVRFQESDNQPGAELCAIHVNVQNVRNTSPNLVPKFRAIRIDEAYVRVTEFVFKRVITSPVLNY